MKKHLTHIAWLVVAAVAFAGGYFLNASAQGGTSGSGRGNGQFATRTFGGRGGANGGNGGGFAVGQILSKDAQSITLQLPNNNSEIVFYSSSTQITKPSAVPATDLVAGTDVVIGGTQNSDGSLTARTIQIRNGNNGNGFGGSQ